MSLRAGRNGESHLILSLQSLMSGVNSFLLASDNDVLATPILYREPP